MNLLEDEWIPVRYPDESIERINPAQITREVNNRPPVELAVENNELRWTIREFLTALFQTVISPERSDLLSWRQSPPSPTELNNALTSSTSPFDVREFMQADVGSDDLKPIRRLPIYGMSENSEVHNKEWFANEKRLDLLCPYCFAMFLFSRNMRKPSGNAWYPGSIRGNTNGVVSTLVHGETLWKKIWRNVLPEKNFPGYEDGLGDESREPYPWTRNETIDGRFKVQVPSENHPYEVLWARPQLIAGRFESVDGTCDGCGLRTSQGVREFVQDNGGFKYEGPWRHPYSPYYAQNEDGTLNYANLNDYESGYRFWKGLLYEQKNEGDGDLASVINFQFERQQSFRMTVMGQSIYSRNNVSFFVDETYPAYSEDMQSGFRRVVDSLVTSAESALGRLKQAVHKCDQQVLEDGQWKNRTGERYPDDAGLYSALSNRFWQETRDPFFELLQDYVENEGPEPFGEWRHILKRATESLYDEFTSSLDVEYAEQAVARDDLSRSIHSLEVNVE